MKNLVILGGGESGIGAALLGQKKGYSVFLSDASVIMPRFKQELIDSEIEFEENGHTLSRLNEADVLVKSPGIPDNISLIQELIKHGKQPISEIEFAYGFCQSKIIAITGSNGKTTTAGLINHLIQGSGISTKVGGNYGVSFARLLVEENVADVYVLEISSFQLDSMIDFRPDVSVLLNITPDHLDRYDYKMELYARSKASITKNQFKPDVFIVNEDDEWCKKMIQEILVERVGGVPYIRTASMYRSQSIIDSFERDYWYEFTNPALKGNHNLFNTQCAVLAAEVVGVDKLHILDRLGSFKNLPHRMEEVAIIDGVLFINDSKGTNVDAVKYALESAENAIVWIAGGIDKGNDYTEIMQLVKLYVQAIICLGVDNTKLIETFQGIVPEIIETQDINQAVQEAFRLAEGYKTVLLSPACSSFDLFENYMERGEQFKAAVQRLID